MTTTICIASIFLSTLSLRRATEHTNNSANANLHFYPRSPCGERLPEKSESLTTYFISIHALLAESDRLCRILYSCPGNFYPRSPCGERLRLYRLSLITLPISIHALLAESDVSPDTSSTQCKLFLSTLSLRRATLHCRSGHNVNRISIHALLAESDPGKVRVVEPGLLFLSTLSLRRATPQ